MSTLPTIIPGPRRVRRKRRSGAAAQPALVLVSASYDVKTSIDLEFDRAIDVSALDGTQIKVSDDSVPGPFTAPGTVTMLDPQTVRIRINNFDSSSGPGVHLNASADNGIVASDDGAAWGGVTDLELPFP